MQVPFWDPYERALKKGCLIGESTLGAGLQKKIKSAGPTVLLKLHRLPSEAEMAMAEFRRYPNSKLSTKWELFGWLQNDFQVSSSIWVQGGLPGRPPLIASWSDKFSHGFGSEDWGFEVWTQGARTSKWISRVLIEELCGFTYEGG